MTKCTSCWIGWIVLMSGGALYAAQTVPCNGPLNQWLLETLIRWRISEARLCQLIQTCKVSLDLTEQAIGRLREAGANEEVVRQVRENLAQASPAIVAPRQPPAQQWPEPAEGRQPAATPGPAKPATANPSAAQPAPRALATWRSRDSVATDAFLAALHEATPGALERFLKAHSSSEHAPLAAAYLEFLKEVGPGDLHSCKRFLAKHPHSPFAGIARTLSPVLWLKNAQGATSVVLHIGEVGPRGLLGGGAGTREHAREALWTRVKRDLESEGIRPALFPDHATQEAEAASDQLLIVKYSEKLPEPRPQRPKVSAEVFARDSWEVDKRTRTWVRAVEFVEFDEFSCCEGAMLGVEKHLMLSIYRTREKRLVYIGRGYPSAFSGKVDLPWLLRESPKEADLVKLLRQAAAAEADKSDQKQALLELLAGVSPQ